MNIEDLIVAHQAKMQTPEARRSTASGARRWNCGSRMPRPTGVRFSGRGLERVRIEVGLCVLAHNLLVVRAAGQRKAADGQNGMPQDAA